MRRVLVIVLLGCGFLERVGAQTGEEYFRKVPYRGSRLEGDVYLCRSDRVVSGGFVKNQTDGSVKEITDVSNQQNVTTWRITVVGGRAEVVAFTGATRTLEAPEEFSVRRGANAVLLTWQDSRPSSQTIAIDTSDSSFVYSGHDVNPFMNKTNIFVGSCRRYF